jgi:nitrite reductase/ring-hydroxylating ferredoxin subunit
MAWIPVGHESEVPAGNMKGFTIENVDLIVYRLEDGWFATADMCTHEDCSLSEGDMEGDEIVCWCHGGAFDIRTGAACLMTETSTKKRLSPTVYYLSVSRFMDRFPPSRTSIAFSKDRLRVIQRFLLTGRQDFRTPALFDIDLPNGRPILSIRPHELIWVFGRQLIVKRFRIVIVDQSHAASDR